MFFYETNPYVRFAHSFDNSEFFNTVAVARDNRLFYVLGGSGTLRIADAAYSIKTGSAVLLPAGTPYRLPRQPVQLIGINFDYRYRPDSVKTPIPLLEASKTTAQIQPEVLFDDEPQLNAPLLCPDASSLCAKLIEICSLYAEKKLHADRRCAGLLLAVLAELLLLRVTPNQTENIVDTIIQYITANFDTPIENQDIGKNFGYHPNYINRLFLKQTGVTLHQYILNYRLSHAVTFLSYTDKSVSEIATLCGFSDSAYFSKLFKKKNGVAPSEFRATSLQQA